MTETERARLADVERRLADLQVRSAGMEMVLVTMEEVVAGMITTRRRAPRPFLVALRQRLGW